MPQPQQNNPSATSKSSTPATCSRMLSPVSSQMSAPELVHKATNRNDHRMEIGGLVVGYFDCGDDFRSSARVANRS